MKKLITSALMTIVAGTVLMAGQDKTAPAAATGKTATPAPKAKIVHKKTVKKAGASNTAAASATSSPKQ